jgi:hypothetical protein
MSKRRRGTEWQRRHKTVEEPRSGAPNVDASGDGEHYPADVAEENIGYQKLAWYAAPFGSSGVALLALAVTIDALKALGRGVIRLLSR